MNALIFGATAGVGRALSEVMAARGYNLLLVSTDFLDLDAQANHLRLLHGIKVQTIVADATQPEECLERIRDACQLFGRLNTLLFPIGISRHDDIGTLSFPEALALINANLLIVAQTISQFLPDVLESEKGNIVGFGSVAAIRGRSANMIYAAAKRGLESYFESLRHLTAKTNVRVQFYRLGYVATQQSFGQRLLFPPAKPELIAEAVVRNFGKDTGTKYLPTYWAILAYIISTLPWPIFKRLKF